MGDPVTILTIASTAVSAFGAVQQGVQAKKASAFERAQYQSEADTARVAALQDENTRRRKLAETLAAQEVYFGANGLDPNSPTAKALHDETIGLAEADIATSRLNYLSRANSYDLAAGQSAAAGNAAFTGGLFKAAGGLLQFGAQWAKVGSIPKSGGGAKPIPSSVINDYGFTP